MTEINTEISALTKVAQRVNWYTKPERLIQNTDLFLCQIMARGHAKDIGVASQYFTKDQFQQAYRKSPPGLFDSRSWSYWGLMLFGNQKYLPRSIREPVLSESDWKGMPRQD